MLLCEQIDGTGTSRYIKYVWYLFVLSATENRFDSSKGFVRSKTKIE